MNVEVKRRWAGEAVDHRPPVASFLDALGELMEGDDRVVVLTSDQSGRIELGGLRDEHPGRVLSGGNAEQNLLGMAAGLASMGKLPVVIVPGAAAAFGAGRTLLVNVAHSGLHVVVAGLPAGGARHDGVVDHMLGDLAAVGTIPGFRILAPCDAEETAKAAITLVDEPGPGYLRLTHESLPVVTGPDSPFDFGHAALLREGQGLTIVACGALVYEALVAADELEDQGVDARLLGIHTVQPLDAEAIGAAAAETGALVVAEEHMRWGGLGARVAQIASGARAVPIEHLHAGESFAPSGAPADVRAALGLHAAGIVAAAQRVLERKGS